MKKTFANGRVSLLEQYNKIQRQGRFEVGVKIALVLGHLDGGHVWAEGIRRTSPLGGNDRIESGSFDYRDSAISEPNAGIKYGSLSKASGPSLLSQ